MLGFASFNILAFYAESFVVARSNILFCIDSITRDEYQITRIRTCTALWIQRTSCKVSTIIWVNIRKESHPRSVGIESFILSATWVSQRSKMWSLWIAKVKKIGSTVAAKKSLWTIDFLSNSDLIGDSLSIIDAFIADNYIRIAHLLFCIYHKRKRRCLRSHINVFFHEIW